MPRERLIGIIGVLVLLAVAVGIAVVADHREPVRLGPERDDPGYSVPPTPTLTPP